MVHALQEVWRALVPAGQLIDLRPRAGYLPLEIIGRGQVSFAGWIDDTRDMPDDRAANAALARMLEAGWFGHEAEAAFDYALYWANLAELRAYVAQRWHRVVLPEATLAAAERRLLKSRPGARLRVRRPVIISRYRRKEP